MKKIFVVLFVLFLVLGGCQRGEEYKNEEKQAALLNKPVDHQELVNATKAQKELLPKKVSPFMTWTDTELVEKTITNKYQVVSDELNSPSQSLLLEMKTTGKTNLVNKAKEIPYLQRVLKSGYSIVYQYYNKENKLLYEIDISEKDLV